MRYLTLTNHFNLFGYIYTRVHKVVVKIACLSRTICSSVGQDAESPGKKFKANYLRVHLRNLTELLYETGTWLYCSRYQYSKLNKT